MISPRENVQHQTAKIQKLGLPGGPQRVLLVPVEVAKGMVPTVGKES